MTDLQAHNQLAVLFFPALLLSLWLTPPVARLASRLGAIDRPGPRKVHETAVPRLGGVAMVVGLFVPLLLFRSLDRTLAAFLAGALIVSVTGLFDDVCRIRPAVKIAGEIVAAGLFVLLGGFPLEGLGDLLGLGEVRLGFLAPWVTVFCMVGVMNALNLSDGLDGLAGGISAIACAFLGIFAYVNHDFVTLNILVALMGALFGFLRYNTHPATLFMGDTGSLLLGYSLSAGSVMLARHGMRADAHLSPVMVAAVLALPITDTLLVMGRRLRKGDNPFLPDKTHLHHRLLGLGLPHGSVVAVLYVSTAAFGFQAWAMRAYPEWQQFAAVLLLGGAIHGLVYAAGRAGFRWDPAMAGVSPPSPGDGDRPLLRLMEKSVRPAGWVIAAGLALPTVWLGAVPQPIGLIALSAGAFVAILFPWKSRRSRSAVCYGLMYAGCICLLALLQFVPGAPFWMPGYLASLSALVMAWVLLKMRYRGHREVLLLSAFEILLVGVSLFVPLVLVPALGLGPNVRRLMLTVGLESVAFLMALKILVKRQPSRHSAIVFGLVMALAVIGAKGLLAQKGLSARISASITPAFARVSGAPSPPGLKTVP